MSGMKGSSQEPVARGSKSKGRENPSKWPNKQGVKKALADTGDKKEAEHSGKAKPNKEPNKFVSFNNT